MLMAIRVCIAVSVNLPKDEPEFAHLESNDRPSRIYVGCMKANTTVCGCYTGRYQCSATGP